MSLDLSQELEAKIQEEAAKWGLAPEAYVRRLIDCPPSQEPEKPKESEEPMTWGQKVLAEWEAEGVLGIWQDRLDTPELAEEFRQNFERKFRLR